MEENDIDIGFLLKKAFKSIFHDPGYIALYLLPVVISLIFMSSMWLVIGADLLAISQSMQDPFEFIEFLKEKIWLLLGFGLIYLIVSLIVSIAVMAGIIKKVEVQETGGRISISEAFSSGFSKFIPLFAAVIIATLVIAGPFFGILVLLILGAIANIAALVCLSAFLLFIIFIPIIYFAIRLSLFAQACVLDNLGPIDCLKRSWHVTKGNVLLIFVTALILGIVYIVITIPFTVITRAFPSASFISSLGYQLALLIFGPLYIIVFTLLYLRLTKKEKGVTTFEGGTKDLTPDFSSSNIFNQIR
jgi:membrane-anchored glycerophosphoryl diester phosphodiesterase (GDPDase)